MEKLLEGQKEVINCRKSRTKTDHLHKMEIRISNSELKCPVCPHKSFSIKSLYGHMRNHPERNWRGMKPPIPGMKNKHFPSLPVPGLESYGNTHPGSGLFFPEWSKTSKRTRTRPGKALMIIPASNQALSASDNEKPSTKIRTRAGKAQMYNQALSGSDNEGCGSYGPDNGERVTENLPPKKRKLESALSSNAGNSNSIIHGGGSSQPGKSHLIPNPGPESSINEKDLVVNDSNANKNPSGARKPHVCDICDRAFKSYQALGGHKSHHNNKSHESMSIGEENESSTTVVDSVVVNVERPEGRFYLAVHKCPLCDRMFSKGQALGGHKRHCQRTMYCGGGQVTRNAPTGFSFDLNMFPPEWVPEELGTGTTCEWSVAYK